MKSILKSIFYYLIALYIVSNYFTGIVFDGGINTFLMTAFFLGVTSLLAKPVINILLLPINLITFGVFRWASSAISLYIVTLIVPQFHITRFYFAGLASKWIDIPQLDFGGILAFILYSFLISIIVSIFHWLFK